MIEAFVRAAIETTSDEAAKPRLRRCVPPLLVAVKNWAGSPAGEVVTKAAELIKLTPLPSAFPGEGPLRLRRRDRSRSPRSDLP